MSFGLYKRVTSKGEVIILSSSRAANQGVRALLYSLGIDYDNSRKYIPFNNKNDLVVILDYFKNKCCYCRVSISGDLVDKDHLIPMNKKAGGLHSWGNVVPSCKSCNNKKLGKDWKLFILQYNHTKDQSEENIYLKTKVTPLV